MSIKQKFMFDYEPDKKSLFLIDLSGAKSGELMKNLDFVAPKVVLEMQKELKSGNYKVGDYFTIRENFVFFIVRKHYMTNFKLEEFKKIAANLPYGENYKTTNETPRLAPYVELLQAIYDNLEIYATSKWEERNKFD